MIPNHSREHFQLNLSCNDLVHSQYSRMECPTCLRGRFHACVRLSTADSLAAASLSTLVRIPPRALGPRGLTSISVSSLFFLHAIKGTPDVTPKPVKLFDDLSYGSHPQTPPNNIFDLAGSFFPFQPHVWTVPHIQDMATLAADGQISTFFRFFRSIPFF
jgi:hypothetical protein